jgi:glucokinase
MLLGIDIGGTKTAVCLGDRKGTITQSARMISRPVEAIDRYFEELFALCDQVMFDGGITDQSAIAAVGISAPGPLDVKRGLLLAPPNNPGWIDVPILKRISARFPMPVYLNNDANGCGLAEHRFGAYRGAQNLIYLTASTGMGAGIIASGRLLQGATDMGGEVGHMVVDMAGPLCPCGRQGCWEVYVGGKNIANRLREKIETEAISTIILDEAGGKLENIDHRAFAAAARQGDPFAVDEWNTYLDRLAQGIGILIQSFNPDVVLLGTIAIKEGDWLIKPLQERLERYCWKWPLEACTVAPSSLGEKIGDLAGLAIALTGLES